MDVFLSYARTDAELIGELRADIEGSRRTVWFDRDLEGGQRWWDEILEQIRGCDLFVLALSDDSARSRACLAELSYAVAVGRTIFPVAVRTVDPQQAPDPIGSLQVVDYRRRSAESAILLLTAVNDAPRPGPLPDPLPDPPPPPVVAIGPLRARVRAPELSYEDQVDVLRELRSRLRRPDELEVAATLLRELRHRPDVAESIGRDIDSALLGIWEDEPGHEEGAYLLRALVTQIQSSHCTPILGWGLTDSLVGPRQLMARKWAQTFEFAMSPHQQEDLPQVAKFVEVMTDADTLRNSLRDFYREQLHERYAGILDVDPDTGLDALIRQAWLRARSSLPHDVHVVLAGMPCSVYVTAQPANLLAEALRLRGRDPVVEICPWRPDVYDWPPSIWEREPGFRPDESRPLVFHVFGNLDVPESIVLTEDDYLDFLTSVGENPQLIPLAVRDALADSALLLLGFRLDEWDVRVLLRSLVGQQGSRRLRKYRHVAAQIELSDEVSSPAGARRFLERYFSTFRQPSIDIFWGSTDRFASALFSALGEKR
jgi:TIR domain/SIR2-like domain